MEIRPATSADAEAIERIRIRGWQAAYRHVFPPEKLDRLPVDVRWWREYLTSPEPGHACFVAESASRLLGFATIGPSAQAEVGELHGLYVDPDAWSRGIGRPLLGQAESRLAAAWTDAVLWTLEDNPRTRRFYEAAGWRADGVRGTFQRLGVDAAVVRYCKRLSSSTSRA